MRYDLYSLSLFETAAATGSIAGAAARHNTVPSAVSKRIADLEAALGVQLFYRQRRGIALTDAGRDLRHHVRGLHRSLQVMESELGAHADGAHGVVRIAANTSAITQFLPEDLAEFTRAHPQIRIRLAEQTTADILDAVRAGLADLGIYSGFDDAGTLSTALYRRDTLVVAAPKGHPVAARDAATLADLLGEDFVALQQGSSIQAHLERRAAEAGGTIRTRVEVMSFDGVRRMVQARLGIAVLPRGAVEPYLDQSGLSMVPIHEPWARRDLMIAVQGRASLGKPVASLVDFLAAEGRSVPAGGRGGDGR